MQDVEVGATGVVENADSNPGGIQGENYSVRRTVCDVACNGGERRRVRSNRHFHVERPVGVDSSNARIESRVTNDHYLTVFIRCGTDSTGVYLATCRRIVIDENVGVFTGHLLAFRKHRSETEAQTNVASSVSAPMAMVRLPAEAKVLGTVLKNAVSPAVVKVNAAPPEVVAMVNESAVRPVARTK